MKLRTQTLYAKEDVNKKDRSELRDDAFVKDANQIPVNEPPQPPRDTPMSAGASRAANVLLGAGGRDLEEDDEGLAVRTLIGV